MDTTKERAAAAAASARPYVERALHDKELRDNIRNAYTSARAVYDELGSRRKVSDAASRLAADKDIQDELRNAIEELRSAASRVKNAKQDAAESGALRTERPAAADRGRDRPPAQSDHRPGLPPDARHASCSAAETASSTRGTAARRRAARRSRTNRGRDAPARRRGSGRAYRRPGRWALRRRTADRRRSPPRPPDLTLDRGAMRGVTQQRVDPALRAVPVGDVVVEEQLAEQDPRADVGERLEGEDPVRRLDRGSERRIRLQDAVDDAADRLVYERDPEVVEIWHGLDYAQRRSSVGLRGRFGRSPRAVGGRSGRDGALPRLRRRARSDRRAAGGCGSRRPRRAPSSSGSSAVMRSSRS